MAASINIYNDPLLPQRVEFWKGVIQEAVEEAAKRAIDIAIRKREKLLPQLAARKICRDAYEDFQGRLEEEFSGKVNPSVIKFTVLGSSNFFNITLRDRAIAILYGSA